MEVRMVVALSGTRDGEDWPPVGGIVDLDDSEASDLIANGLAIAVGAVEAASVESGGETAAVKKSAARKRTAG